MVTIGITDRDPHREAGLVRALRGQRPRGLILAASGTDGPGTTELGAALEAFAGIGRVVALGGRPDVDRCVDVDNHAGAAALAAELVGLGYRDSVIVAAAEGIRLSDERMAGFREGFIGAGGSVGEVCRAGFLRDAAYAAVGDLLAAGGLPGGTIVFGVTDVVAIGAMAALRDAGREVGTDIAVAGFDDIDAARDVVPGLTTVRVPLEDLGRRALRAAIEAEWDADAEPPLPLEVVVRGSTPPRG